MFSLRTRRWWLALPLLLVLAVVLHTAIWRAMAARMEQGVAVWTAERRVLGWGVQHAPAVRGGWPLSVRLRLPGFELVGGPRTTPSSLHWRAEALELRVAMLDWDTLLVSPRGLQRLEVDGQEFPFAADRMELSLPLEGGRTPREGALEVERLRLNSPLGPFELRRGSLSARSRLSATEAEPALSVELDLRELALPAAGPGALGAQVRQAAIEASLSGPLPPVRHLTQRAETWRDAGGTLELRRIELQWGPVTASLSATGTLDDALQPMGAGQLQVIGVDDAIEALVVAGVLARNASGPARAVAALLARPGVDGGPPVLELPVTLQERRVGLARLPLGRFPPLVWPAPPEVPDAARDPSLPATD